MIVAKSELARKRIMNGWSQVELCRRAGVSHAIVCRAEKGRPMYAATVKKIADALECDIEDIFEIRIQETKRKK